MDTMLNNMMLQRHNLMMKSVDHVKNLLNILRIGGKNKLQVIIDFDRTLTKPYVDGKDSLSSYGIFNLCPSLPKKFVEESSALFSYYRPFEIDNSLSTQQKSSYSEEWAMKKAEQLHFDLDINEIDIAVEKAKVVLRDGTDKLLETLNNDNVPVLVFSGGLGDTVKGVLRHQGVLHPNMHVIANYLNFEGNRVNGLQGDIIHVFNKNESAIKNTEYFHELADKNNVILLGDCLGDANMAEGVKDLNVVLKIGFLQYHVDEHLEEFMDHFDIVLINDMSMDVISEILKTIK